MACTFQTKYVWSYINIKTIIFYLIFKKEILRNMKVNMKTVPEIGFQIKHITQAAQNVYTEVILQRYRVIMLV